MALRLNIIANKWRCIELGPDTKNKREDQSGSSFRQNLRPKAPIVCLSSNSSSSQEAQRRKPGKLKASRSLRNNVNLRQELQDFIFAVGLPSDSVPTFKELSLHGRQDLANIVRRRGYKAIAHLLKEPKGICTAESAEKININSGGGVSLDEFKDPDSSSVQAFNVPPHDSSDSSDSSDIPGNFQEKNSNLHILYSLNAWSSSECPSTINGTDAVHMIESSLNYSLESSSYMSLREKAAEFVRTGDFYDIEGEYEIEDHQGDEENYKNARKPYERDDTLPLTPYGMDADKSPDGPSNSDSSITSNSRRSIVTKAAYESYYWSDYPLTPDTIAVKKSAFWTSEVQPYSREEDSNSFHTKFSDQLQFNDNGTPESAGAEHMLMKIQHFNSLLHLKESEVAKLKRELEEEKAKLYSVQAKAMAEIAHVKQILSEKESELSSADEALSGLKQVRIEYWGEGTLVEVTGSFNGWQHHISLEPDAASEIRNSKEARGPLMWSKELWLYPGSYEIKFIVDGNWQLDNRREVVTRDTYQNNLLKVEH